jgi:ATP-dependent DNA helicase DinG
MIKINDELTIYFPLKYKPREQQIKMLELTKKSINSGKKNILLNAPTGSGKSFYTIMLANFYKNYINSSAKFDIITNSKLLQQQYKDEFEFINDLRGQSNYKCSRHNTDCRTGKELNKATKQFPCHSCPYDDAKENWIQGDISLSNFHLYNSFTFYVPITLVKRNANVLIIDEAHDLEEVFCDFISIKLSPRILKNYGMETHIIEIYERKFSDIKTAGGFINFVERDFVPYIAELREQFETLLADASDQKLKVIYAKYIDYIITAEEKFNGLLKDFEKNENNWILDITFSKTREIELNMQPIWGNVYLNDAIWDKYDHVIFMSGSILDKNMFSYLNGFEEKLTDYYELDSTFPVKNRPLYYVQSGKMTYNEREATFKNQIEVIEKILKKYKNERGIIHTTNYEIAKWLKQSINDRRLIYHETENREKQLIKMKNKKNGIIVSPSMTSGISLDDDLSRFQVMLKVPYPNISSNKIKARQSSNKKWYAWRTIVEITQAYGRSVRSETDWADTFILDSCFSDILKYNRYLFPKYIIEAIKILK